jgi:hypothetical protein
MHTKGKCMHLTSYATFKPYIYASSVRMRRRWHQLPGFASIRGASFKRLCAAKTLPSHACMCVRERSEEREIEPICHFEANDRQWKAAFSMPPVRRSAPFGHHANSCLAHKLWQTLGRSERAKLQDESHYVYCHVAASAVVDDESAQIKGDKGSLWLRRALVFLRAVRIDPLTHAICNSTPKKSTYTFQRKF